MKLLLDQDVYAKTRRFLESLGHDVIPVAQIGMATCQELPNRFTTVDLSRLVSRESY